MLEQAAMAVLHLEQPARRRFALLMTIASHRYQKTGSKALARRCGLQALSIYPRQATSVSGQTWAAARNHLEHALGRQAYNTGQSEQAIQHFVRLLAKHDIAAETPFTAENGATDDSGSGQSDESFLDDFKLAWDLLGERADEVARELDLALPGPVFDVKATTIVTTAQNVDAQDPAIRILEAQFLERGYPYSHSRGRVRKAPASLLPDSTVKSVIVDGEAVTHSSSRRRMLKVFQSNVLRHLPCHPCRQEQPGHVIHPARHPLGLRGRWRRCHRGSGRAWR